MYCGMYSRNVQDFRITGGGELFSRLAARLGKSYRVPPPPSLLSPCKGVYRGQGLGLRVRVTLNPRSALEEVEDVVQAETAFGNNIPRSLEEVCGVEEVG